MLAVSDIGECGGDVSDRASSAGYPVVVADESSLLAVIGMHAEQQGQATARGEFHGGDRGGGHNDMGMWLGQRSGHDADLGKVKVCSAGGEAGLGQSGQEKVQRLGEAVLVAVPFGAEHREVDPWTTPSDAELEPSVGQLVEQCGCAANAMGCWGGQDADRGTNCDPLGGAEQVTRQDDR